ncbi:MAG TPA: alpha/beta hydrolase, partial [Candidatus Methylomirabilis sp.]|nr:alpha/beta hydrolase [Candidatus Methylomirabilis sp.]
TKHDRKGIAVDAQVGRLIEMLNAVRGDGAPQLWQLSPAAARRSTATMFALLNEGGPRMAETRTIEIPGRHGKVPARLYVPEGAGRVSSGLLYLHGGGWVIGSPDTHDRLARELAAGIGARVVSLEYGLAPERPFPHGLDDCVDAAAWLVAKGRRLGIDTARLLIGGDSAGANLAAATLLKRRDEGGRPWLGAVYIYGAFSVDCATPSVDAWGDRDLILSRKEMQWFRDQYLGTDGSADDPYVSPIRGDLRGLPPAMLVVGTLDPLLSDSELFADALQRGGVKAELHVFQDAPHAFVQMFMLTMAADAIARISTFARSLVG